MEAALFRLKRFFWMTGLFHLFRQRRRHFFLAFATCFVVYLGHGIVMVHRVHGSSISIKIPVCYLLRYTAPQVMRVGKTQNGAPPASTGRCV